MSRGVLAFWLAAGVALSGCVPARARLDTTAAVDRRAEVEALIRGGCYACLRDALSLVEQGHAPDRRFDILALLASRVREIGFADSRDWRALASAAMPPAPSTREILLAALVVHARAPQGGLIFPQPDLTPSERREIARLASATWPSPPADPVDAYFHLSLECLGLSGTRRTPAHEAPPGDWPLAAYRRATCGQPDADALATLITAEPRFTEALYFSASASFASGALIATEQALERFESGFPGTPAVAFLRGQVWLALEEFEEAAAQFALVLAVEPAMPEALLYHLRALSQIDPERGEAAADRLLSLGTWYPGEAYYWRAWNRRALARLDEAAADIDRAKPVLFNAAVPKLAGFIAYERNDMPLAEAELVESLDRNDADCEVQFALGQVLLRTGRWAHAGERFVSTARCSRAAQAALTARLGEIAAATLDPVRRQRLAARVERDRSTEHRREGLATFAGATAFARANQPGDARPLAEAAARWPDLLEKSRELLVTLPP